MPQRRPAKSDSPARAKSSAPHTQPAASSGYVLEDQVGHLLRRAHQRHCGLFAAGIGAELTPMQFAALAKIAAVGEISQNRLGRRIAMDPATTQGVVKRLSERELIVADADPGDRRRYVWRATAAGRRLLKTLLPPAERITAETLAPLSSSERSTFLRLLKKLV